MLIFKYWFFFKNETIREWKSFIYEHSMFYFVKVEGQKICVWTLIVLSFGLRPTSNQKTNVIKVIGLQPKHKRNQS